MIRLARNSLLLSLGLLMLAACSGENSEEGVTISSGASGRGGSGLEGGIVAGGGGSEESVGVGGGEGSEESEGGEGGGGVADSGGVGGSGGVADSGGVGGSGGVADSGGIGGTGGTTAIVSVGMITGFGSVFVNGVEFETSPNIIVEELIASETALSVGMIVRVEGEVNSGGLTGFADTLTFSAELIGPIADVPEADPNGLSKTFTVLGVTVVVDKNGTVFDDSDPGFTFETIAQDDVVGVSGFFEANGVLRATYIERKGQTVFGTTKVKVSGTVSGFGGGSTFQLGPLTITFDPTGSQTNLAKLPGQTVSKGLRVEVKGTLVGATEVFADKISLKKGPFGLEEDAASIEGKVGSFKGLSDFKIKGQAVDASGATFIPEDLAGSLGNGNRVVAEGPIVAGVLIAEKIESTEVEFGPFENGVSIEGAVGAFKGLANFKVKGQTVDASIAIFEPAGLAGDIRNGTRVIVEGPIVVGVLLAIRVQNAE